GALQDRRAMPMLRRPTVEAVHDECAAHLAVTEGRRACFRGLRVLHRMPRLLAGAELSGQSSGCEHRGCAPWRAPTPEAYVQCVLFRTPFGAVRLRSSPPRAQIRDAPGS